MSCRADYDKTTRGNRKEPFEEAFLFFKKAVEADGNLIEAWNNAAVARMNAPLDVGTEATEEALRFVNKAIELSPHEATFFFNRGNVYGMKGDGDRAIADYNKALELNPTLERRPSVDKGRHHLAVQGIGVRAVRKWADGGSRERTWPFSPQVTPSFIATGEYLYSVGLKHLVMRNNDEVLDLGLRNEHAIEWVMVMGAEGCQLSAHVEPRSGVRQSYLQGFLGLYDQFLDRSFRAAL